MIHKIIAIALILSVSAIIFGQKLQIEQRGNQLYIDDKLTPITMATELNSSEDIILYKSLGFNTICLKINSRGNVLLERYDQMIKQSEDLGLYVIIEFAEGTWCEEYYYDPYNEEYLDAVELFVKTIVNRYKDSKNLIGYIINSIPESKYAAFNDTFTGYLRNRYGNIEALTNSWSANQTTNWSSNQTSADISSGIRTPITSFDLISANTIDGIIAMHKNPESIRIIREDYNSYMQTIIKRNYYMREFFIYRFGSDLNNMRIRWKLDRLTWTFESWDDLTKTAIINRERDSSGSIPTLLFDLSEFYMSRYPLLIGFWADSIKKSDNSNRLIFAGSHEYYRTLCNIPQTGIINGVYTQYLPKTLEVDIHSQNPHRIDIARHGNKFIVIAGVDAAFGFSSLQNACYSAAMRGACGIAINNWNDIKDNGRDFVRDTLADFDIRSLLGRSPEPTAAFVYIPYGSGPGSSLKANGNTYGYLPSTVYPGGGQLFHTLKNGTIFGQFDYLNDDDLKTLNPKKYKVIIMPNAFNISAESADKLNDFCNMGGTLLADAGLAMRQADDNKYMLPKNMLSLFGLVNGKGTKRVLYNLDPYSWDKRFPSLRPGIHSLGRNDGYTVREMGAMIPLHETTLLFEMVKKKEFTTKQARIREILPTVETDGVYLRAKDNDGMAIYAPFNLYELWPATDNLFTSFHHDLFARDAKVRFSSSVQLISSNSEIATFLDGSIAVWSKNMSNPRINIANADMWLYSSLNAIAVLDNNRTTSVQFSISGYHTIQKMPIFVNQILDIDNLNIAVSEFKNIGNTMEFNISVNGMGKIDVTAVSSSIYNIENSSAHTVIIGSNSRNTITKTVFADNKGRVSFDIPNGTSHIWIQPEKQPAQINVSVTTNDSPSRKEAL